MFPVNAELPSKNQPSVIEHTPRETARVRVFMAVSCKAYLYCEPPPESDANLLKRRSLHALLLTRGTTWTVRSNWNRLEGMAACACGRSGLIRWLPRRIFASSSLKLIRGLSSTAGARDSLWQPLREVPHTDWHKRQRPVQGLQTRYGFSWGLSATIITIQSPSILMRAQSLFSLCAPTYCVLSSPAGHSAFSLGQRKKQVLPLNQVIIA